MAQMKPEELEIMKLFVYLNLKPKRFAGKDSRRKFETPDFHVHFQDRLRFYCEQKSANFSPERIGAGMDHWTAQNKIKNICEKAASQFSSINSGHAIPNVLTWKSNNPQLNHSWLEWLIRGEVDLFGNKYDLGFYLNRARSYLKMIDLHIFMYPWGPPYLIYVHNGTGHAESLKQFFDQVSIDTWGDNNIPIQTPVAPER